MINKITKKIGSCLLVTLLTQVSLAEVNHPGAPLNTGAGTHKTTAGDCVPATSQVDLFINNVRARIMNGGDMWWDLVGTARYIVPKVAAGSGQPEVSALFAGGIWIGGYDLSGNLKIAAATYRQNGNDYFPGPLDDVGTTNAATCTAWDKHFTVFGAEIDAFIAGDHSISSTPQNILNWPGRGNPHNPLTAAGNKNFAPFADTDGDGFYDPLSGDFPIIGQCDKLNYADQMIWWVYNDNGNIHTESSSTPINLEVQALAFSFKTNDEVNDMTFCKYSLLNKAPSDLTQTYMGQWVDPDLGCYTDDYIGCNVAEGLGIVYNADAKDENCGSAGYGDQPPFLGIDYFQGPKDELGHELGMSSFLYYVNDFSVRGNPEIAAHYYGYLSGFWKDGTPFTEGGNAYGGSTPTKYVFPASPDDAVGWSMCTGTVNAADMRFIQSSGPFTLKPGAANDIIIGVVWVRPPQGTYPCPKLDLLLKADKKAQALFNNCFELIDGPDAPDMNIVELDRQLVLELEGTNTPKVEKYAKVDPIILAQYHTPADSLKAIFHFEGYQIYQLTNPTISTQELNDPTKAKLIFQVDKKNGVSKIINYIFDPNVNQDIPTLMVNGADAGIKHSFQVLNDAFATGDNRLINHKSYYYMVASYAYNGFSHLDTLNEIVDTSGNHIFITNLFTQRVPFLQGRKNIKVYTAIPHIPSPELEGTVIHSGYGDGPVIKRMEGAGNGGNEVTLTDESIAQLLADPDGFLDHPTYKGGEGPVQVKVIDPKKVPSYEFELWLNDTTNNNRYVLDSLNSVWTLKNLTTGEVIHSDATLLEGDEQLIADWGLSIYVKQISKPGKGNLFFNGVLINSTVTFAEPQNLWLDGVHDGEGETNSNWIRDGSYAPDLAEHPDNYAGSKLFFDPTGQFENIAGGTIAPFKLCAYKDHLDFTPGYNDNQLLQSQLKADSLISVDLVFTSDKTKWTKCLVVEAQNEVALAEGGAKKCGLRKHASWNGLNNTYSSDPNDIGVSYFPGYAINPETGERLNIMFAEDSWLNGENGKDMIWNPTSNLSTPTFDQLWGGRHYIYVLQTRYNDAEFGNMLSLMKTGSDVDKRAVYKNVAWAAVPMLSAGYHFKSWQDGFIPTTTSISIRVNRTYQKYVTDESQNNSSPRYYFNTADIAAVKGNNDQAKNALDTINLVPNPYYAYSSYERDQLDNRVKITNLPIKCTIIIYTLNGTLIRKFERDDNSTTDLDWDLKNDAGVPIASGIYLIHINAPGIGERTLKWVGIIRPTDLDSF